MHRSSEEWLVDSGASIHCSNSSEGLVNFQEMQSSLFTATGEEAPIRGVGDLAASSSLTFRNVCVCDKLTDNVLSVYRLCEDGYKVQFEGEKFLASHPSKKCLRGTADKSGQYVLNLKEEINHPYDDEAILMASKKGQADVVKNLLSDPRSDPSYRSNEAMHIAANRGHAEVVSILLSDPRTELPAKDKRGLFRWALYSGHDSVVKCLLVDPMFDAQGFVRETRAAGNLRLLKIMEFSPLCQSLMQ